MRPTREGEDLGETGQMFINSRRPSGFAGDVEDDLIVQVNYDPSRISPR